VIKAIREGFLAFSGKGIVIANEMTWMLHGILIEKTRSQLILIAVLKGIPQDDQVLMTGLFAIIGSTLETVRPY